MEDKFLYEIFLSSFFFIKVKYLNFQLAEDKERKPQVVINRCSWLGRKCAFLVRCNLSSFQANCRKQKYKKEETCSSVCFWNERKHKHSRIQDGNINQIESFTLIIASYLKI